MVINNFSNFGVIMCYRVGFCLVDRDLIYARVWNDFIFFFSPILSKSLQYVRCFHSYASHITIIKMSDPSQMTTNIHLKQQEQEVLQQMVGSRRAQGLVLRMWISILGGLNCWQLVVILDFIFIFFRRGTGSSKLLLDWLSQQHIY